MNYELRITNWRKYKAARVAVAAVALVLIIPLALADSWLRAFDEFKMRLREDLAPCWEQIVRFVKEAR